MKEPISIKEIMAVVLKRGKAILCAAIALAILLGGVQGVRGLMEANNPENTAEKVAQRNEEAMADYEKQRSILQGYIDNTLYKLEEQERYNEESLLMQLDPNNEYRCHMLMAITGVDETAFQQVYEQEGTPVDYITARIQAQYISYWNNMDMSEEFDNNPYEGVHEKYIREVVTLEKVDEGQLFLVANAPDAETAYDLCQTAYNALVSAYETVADASYAHELVAVNTATKLGVDSVIAKTQFINREDKVEYEQELYEYEQQMAKLKKPSRETVPTVSGAVKDAVKWAVVGGVVGFIMACAFVWLLYILSDGVETSRQAEAILEVPFFGSAAGKRDIFVRLANRFVGERQWKDRDQAVQYIAENLKSRVYGQEKIALVSTLPVPAEDTGIQMLLKVMGEQGHTVVFAGKAEENPAAIAALRESNYVILAERLGTSNRAAMLHTVEQAKQLDAQVLGFITI